MENNNSVILARVSSLGQKQEGYSLDSQTKFLSDYFAKLDYPVIKVFEIAETASKQQSRKVFQELMTFITTNDVKHLAIEKTDRFTRNLRDAVTIDDWLEADETRRLHAVKEGLIVHKYAKSDVKFMWNIYVSVAKRFTDNLREEAMKGWNEKLAQGWLPGVPPPGYMTSTENGKRIHVPNPETKTITRQMFERYLEPGQTTITIAREMAERSIRTRKGRAYNKSKVHKMLANPFYIGINRFNGKDYPGMQETFISKDLFERVQQKLHGGRPHAYAKHAASLQGLIRCEDCHSVVTWQYQKGRYYGACRRESEACRKSKLLREDAVESELLDTLRKLVCPAPEIIDWVAQAMRESHKDRIVEQEQLVATLQAQISRINGMDDRLYDDKLAGEINQERYEAKHEQFLNDKAQLAERIAQVEAPLGKWLEHRVAVLELSQKAAELYPSKSVEQKKLILSKLFSKMSLKSGSLSVTYSKFAQVIAENVVKTNELMEA